MIPVYIGWDSREKRAWHTLANSIIAQTSQPVSIIPLKQDVLRWSHLYWRPHDILSSTEFSLTRFLVPYLSNYQGYSIFMDCDMLCQVDLAELLTLVKQEPTKACWVVQHDYTPTTTSKMDGCSQTVYPRKNWSSLIVFNNLLCQSLTLDYVNQASPADLHQFKWIKDSEIGSLPPTWNWLVGEYPENPEAKIIHYTLGGPWFKTYMASRETDKWHDAWRSIS